jgi:type 1 glutamine amidotransferase
VGRYPALLIAVAGLLSCSDAGLDPLSAVCAGAPASAGTRILLFSRTAGYRHASIPDAQRAIMEIGPRIGVAVDTTEDPAAFDDLNLSRFAAVVFLMTTGEVLDVAQQAAFERFIRAGGGFVGVHSASDTEYDWPWYGALVGAYFASHAPIQQAAVIVTDAGHPSTRCLLSPWVRTDEWYEFRSPPVALTVATVRLNGTSGTAPIAWYHQFDGGRAWYTAMGHTSETYTESAFRGHLAGGILWAVSR